MWMSFSERNASLIRLLQIEADIRRIEQGRDYLRLKRNLRALQNPSAAGGTVTVSPPDNLDTTVEVRRNSANAQAFIDAYVERMRGDRERIDSLNSERVMLRGRLFPAATEGQSPRV